jgi:hypothetical protein
MTFSSRTSSISLSRKTRSMRARKGQKPDSKGTDMLGTNLLGGNVGRFEAHGEEVKEVLEET